MDEQLPQTMGHEAAGVVDELGEGVADVAVGDRVFGLSAQGASQAELAVLSWYAPIPPSLDFAAVQLAVARGARVIGTASPANHDYLRSLGAEPVAYGELIGVGRFSLPVARTFPLADIAEAHRVSEDGHVRGKLVLLVG